MRTFNLSLNGVSVVVTRNEDGTFSLPPELEKLRGFDVALKPASEHWILARKPLAGTVAANVQKHGTGAINVDACRIEGSKISSAGGTRRSGGILGKSEPLGGWEPTHTGRWPANVILDEFTGALLDEQSGVLTSGANPTRRGVDGSRQVLGEFSGQDQCAAPRGLDTGGASRFFYCAKPSTSERDLGLESLPEKTGGEATNRKENSDGLKSPRAGAGRTGGRKNIHPTVKSISLMRYLCRLITPKNGLVLDPFCGSGTTGCAAVLEGFNFLGIEREGEYVEIARLRIARFVLDTSSTPALTVHSEKDENESKNESKTGSEIGSETEIENALRKGESIMAFLPKGFGSEVAKAEATISRQRINDGDYVFLHKAIFSKETKAGDAIIIEHKIIEAKSIVPGIEPSPIGSTWGYFMPKYGDAAVMCKPNLKAYVLGLLGIDSKKVTDQDLGDTIDAIGGESQIARGMLVRGVTFHTNKRDGEDFLGMNWYPVAGENDYKAPSVLKRRAELDAESGGALPGGTTAPSAVPTPPSVPSVAAAPSVPGANPFAGWTKHPTTPGYWYKGQEVKLETDLVAGR